jgi:hypothetical protein
MEEPLRVKAKDWEGTPWSSAQDEAFACIKKAVTSAPCLSSPKVDLPYELHVDASQYGMGAVLQQNTGSGLHPIAFFSKKLNSAQRLYANPKREFLGMISALRHWRHLLGGAGVVCIVHTDHITNTHFMSARYDLTDKTLAGWVLEIQDQYPGVEVQHVKGKDNPVADALSRIAAYADDDDIPIHVALPDMLESVERELGMINHSALVFTFGEDTHLCDAIRAGYVGDKWLADHPTVVKLGEKDYYYMPDNRIYVPQCCVDKILDLCHDKNGHKGYQVTLDSVISRYWFPMMQARCKAHVQACLPCSRNKKSTLKKAGVLHQTPFPCKRWAQQSMDFITGLPSVDGYDSMYVVCDRGSSKMVHLAKCKTTITAKQVADLYLDIVYKHHGLPEQIISDRDSKFMSNWYQALMTALGVVHIPSSSHHPEFDGQTEHANKIIGFYLRLFCEKRPKDWVKYIPMIEFELNYHRSQSTGCSAFELCFGEQPIRLKDQLAGVASQVPSCDDWMVKYQTVVEAAQQSLQQAFYKQKEQFDKHKVDVVFKEGDLVMLSTQYLNIERKTRCQKMKPPFIGPLKVLRVLGNGVTLKLEVPASWRATDNWHSQYVKLYVPDAGNVISAAEGPVTVLETVLEKAVPVDDPGKGVETLSEAVDAPVVSLSKSHPVKEVARIMDWRLAKGVYKYLLSWVNDDGDETSWMPEIEAAQCAGFAKAKEEWVSKHNLRDNTRRVSFVRGMSTGILKSGKFLATLKPVVMKV